MSKDKIRVIPTEKDKLLGAVEAMKRSMPGFVEYLQMKAHCMRVYYLALVEAGFEPEQALFLTSKYSDDSDDK